MTIPVIRDLEAMQAVLATVLTRRDRYTIHPGDLVWWLFHQDPRRVALEPVLRGDSLAVLDPTVPEIDVFGGRDRIGLLDARPERFAAHPTVGWVSERDAELKSELTGRGLRPSAEVMVAFLRPTTPREAALPGGFVVRPLGGEAEADTRRAASHAAFGSTMDAGEHLARYLRFMRSPGYEPSRDLVAVAPDGAVASFLIWWGDAATGIAQLEPVGTHPNHQRRGLGAAVFAAALGEMAAAGMHTVRVCTDASRIDAVAFYESLGFLRDHVIRWWRPGGGA